MPTLYRASYYGLRSIPLYRAASYSLRYVPLYWASSYGLQPFGSSGCLLALSLSFSLGRVRSTVGREGHYSGLCAQHCRVPENAMLF